MYYLISTILAKEAYVLLLAGNPANLNTCILCENNLPTHARAVQTKDMAPPAPVTSGHDRECSSCHRVNSPDARFCDWCGAKVRRGFILIHHGLLVNFNDIKYLTVSPFYRFFYCFQPTAQGMPMTCSRCGASNNLYAAFCASCGVSISAPNREVNNSSAVSQFLGLY